MQIHKLLRACSVKVSRGATKVPLGRSSTSGVWGYRSGLFSPLDGDSIYRKAYPNSTLHISRMNMPSETRPLRSPDPQLDLGQGQKPKTLQQRNLSKL
ncbi:hypothetical protein Zmor_021836 [Zophobas morio]|uniref:Uncharacterized protein n=1 Tax=Zophobas morio TaxID=2755281 RepID=A0AA38I397_9CUCU|nr:hypothetical protein Zmor_021836 [Zophobas morio]